MHPDLLDVLDNMREEIGKPIFVSSGYRCANHPIEAMKETPGEHSEGMAVDIICYTDMALTLLKLALERDITRIGLHQKGRASGRYMHMGIGNWYDRKYPASIWTY